MKRNGSGSRSEAQFFFSLQRCYCCFFFPVVLWCCSGREKQVSKKTKIPSSVGAFVFFLPLFQKSFPSLLSIHFSLVQLSKGSPAFVPSSVSFSVYFFLCFPFPPASCLYRLPLCLSLPSSICLVLLCFLPPPFSFVQTLPPFSVSKEPSLIPPKSPSPLFFFFPFFPSPLLLCWVLFIEPSEWGFLPLRMGAGQAAAGRPLGATVEVRLQRHGASG